MILETIGFLQILADIIASILNVLSPLVIPIGDVMVKAVNILLEYFPANNLTIYIVIFILFVILGVIVNTSFIGDRLKEIFNKFDEKHFKKYSRHIPESADDAFKTIDKKKKESGLEKADKEDSNSNTINDVKGDEKEENLKED